MTAGKEHDMKRFICLLTAALLLAVLPAALAKGLEFDCVLIADAEASQYPDERFYAKLFYVLCTRPLHRLRLFAAGEMTPLLRQP